MPKIVHLADVHVGKKFHKLGHQGDVLRSQILKSFRAGLRIAVEEKADLVVIAGDLFDSNRVSPAMVRSVMGELQKINPIPVVILPGTHDCYDTQSVYRRKDWELCPHIKIFRENRPQTFTFPQFSLAVHGRANQSNKGLESPLKELQPAEDAAFNLAVAHGTLQIPGRTSDDDYVFTPEEIKNSRMDYIALGHWHKTFNCSEDRTTAYYCGPPQQLSFSQGGGSVNLVCLTKDGVAVEPRLVGGSTWLNLSYNLPLNLAQLSADLAGISEETLVCISLNGCISRREKEDFLRLEEEWEEKFLYLEVNWSGCRVLRDQLSLDSFPPNTVSHHFVCWMNERITQAVGDEQELLADAMHMGMDYLLG